jgi:hypothetical protein
MAILLGWEPHSPWAWWLCLSLLGAHEHDSSRPVMETTQPVATAAAVFAHTEHFHHRYSLSWLAPRTAQRGRMHASTFLHPTAARVLVLI